VADELCDFAKIYFRPRNISYAEIYVCQSIAAHHRITYVGSANVQFKLSAKRESSSVSAANITELDYTNRPESWQLCQNIHVVN
jgi:hypothetical protein